MADFDWKTEDEDTSFPSVREFTLRPKRPPWLYPLLIFITIALSAAAIYAMVVRRGEATEEAIKADVQRTHELVMEAAESKDVELFTTFLSGADRRWQNAQIEAVRRGRFDESSWLGFYLDQERPYRLDDITLSPDLNEAAVTYTRWYQPIDRPERAIPLQQTAIYRRSQDRWLFAPPRDLYSDNTGIFIEGELTIFYPRRDENHVLRIADNLVAGLPEICNSQPTRSCPDGWQLNLDMTGDPDTILNPTTMEGPITALSLKLPTPSLVGIPLDAAGYNLLYENYHRVLQRRMTSVLSRYMAQQSGLVQSVSELPPSHGLALAASVINSNLPDTDLAVTCSSTKAGATIWTAFRYDLRTGDWSQVFQKTYAAGQWGSVIPLAGGQDFAVLDYAGEEQIRARLLLVQNGETILVSEDTVHYEDNLRAPYFPRGLDPTGRYLTLEASEIVGEGWYLLDRASCTESNGCNIQKIVSQPVWSPDGGQMLLAEPVLEAPNPAAWRLYRAGETGQNPEEISLVSTSFWLDEQTYGYARLNDNDEMELVLADSGDDAAQVWLTTADLMPLVPEERNWTQMSIWNVWVNPANPQMMLLMTTPTNRQNSGPYDFFLVQGDPAGGQEQQIEWLFSNPYPAATGLPPFSPDGRYLLATQRGAPIYFQDLETGSAVSVNPDRGFIVDWTPDGRFYVQWSDTDLTLNSPEKSYHFLIANNFSACYGLQWVEN